MVPRAPNAPDLHAMEERQNAAMASGDFASLERGAEEIARAFPDQADDMAMTVALARCARRDVDGALDALSAALDRGLWWPAQWFEMYSGFLQPLSDLPRFAEVRRRSSELQAASPKFRSSPSALLLPRPGPPGPGPAAWLLVLHGRGQNARCAVHPWRAASQAAAGGVVIGESSQFWSSQRYCWDDVVRAESDLQGIFRENAPAPKGGAGPQLLLGGYSQGAALAVHAALLQTVPATAFLAVCPTESVALTRGTTLISLAAHRRKVPLRGRLIVGESDPSRSASERLTAALNDAGVECSIEIARGNGHDYPADLAERLPGLVRALLP